MKGDDDWMMQGDDDWMMQGDDDWMMQGDDDWMMQGDDDWMMQEMVKGERNEGVMGSVSLTPPITLILTLSHHPLNYLLLLTPS